MGRKRSRQEAKAAEAAADEMASAFSNMAGLVVEKAVEYLMENLRHRPQWLYTLSSCARDSTLEHLLFGGKKASAAGQQKKDLLKITRVKKWKNLTESQMKAIVAAVRPDWSDGNLPGASTWTDLGYALLGVAGDNLLPHHTYPQRQSFRELTRLCVKRYEHLGKRFDGISLENTYGLWRMVNDKLETALKAGVAVSIPMHAPGASATIDDVWSPDAEVQVHAAYGTGKFAIKDIFQAADEQIFPGEDDADHWQIPNYQAAEVVDEDEDQDDEDSNASASAAGSGRGRGKAKANASSSWTPLALRQRLSQSAGSSATAVAAPPS